MSYSRRTAYHEAGHAAMALILGATLTEVVVSRVSGGHITYATDPAPADRLRIALAGRVAEAYGLGDVLEAACSADRARADLAAYDLAEGDLALADELRATALEDVRCKLAWHWSSVETIAELLLESPHGAIDGADLRKLVLA